MIDRETIKAVKAVDMNIIFDEFNWGIFKEKNHFCGQT